MGHIGDGRQSLHRNDLFIIFWSHASHHPEDCGPLREADVVKFLDTSLFEDVINHGWYVVVTDLVPGELPERG